MARIVSAAALIAVWQLAGAPMPSAMLLAAALAMAGLIVALTHTPAYAVAETPARGAALRDQTAKILPRLRDPGAAGRPRPRAP